MDFLQGLPSKNPGLAACTVEISGAIGWTLVALSPPYRLAQAFEQIVERVVPVAMEHAGGVQEGPDSRRLVDG